MEGRRGRHGGGGLCGHCQQVIAHWLVGATHRAGLLPFTLGRLGSVNDYSKEKQFRALNAIKNDHPVTVVRGGASTRISIYDVVVGDLLHMQSGDIVPADGIFLSGDAAEADESSATGESDNVKKGHGPARDPIFLSGTQVIPRPFGHTDSPAAAGPATSPLGMAPLLTPLRVRSSWSPARPPC